jgi:hypothetical protein
MISLSPRLQALLDKNPRYIFLIDSLGAMLTAFMLGFVLARLEPVFGMSPKVLYVLSFFAGVFFLYSLLCFLAKMTNWKPYLKIIAIANLLYCCFTAGMMIYCYDTLKAWGFV